MDKLFEHTLKRQTQEMTEMREENAKMREQVRELALLLKGQLKVGSGTTRQIEGATSVNASTINNTTNIQVNQVNQINQVNIVKPEVPWDGEKRINVSTAQIAAAFAENARLKEYVRLEEHQLTDPEIAPPYVAELLMDLTKRAHADPAARNVYLNPKRADQALVHMATGKWEVMALQEATRLIFDGVAKAMVRVTLSNEERRQLPLEAQNALAMAGLLYDDEPEEYAKKAKAPMAAHLANTAPSIPQLGQ